MRGPVGRELAVRAPVGRELVRGAPGAAGVRGPTAPAAPGVPAGACPGKRRLPVPAVGLARRALPTGTRAPPAAPTRVLAEPVI